MSRVSTPWRPRLARVDDDPADPRRTRPGGRDRDAARPSDGRLVIARPFGVPVDVTPAWFLVAGLITYGFAATVEREVPGLGSWRYAVSLTFALLLYLSVLVHELSHTVVALRSGLPVSRISLHLLGGVSEIERPAQTPGREAGIAVAGPLVSLVVAGLAFGIGELLDPDTVGRLLARALSVSNLLVGAFNLLPGLPLDGGRVVSAVVWRATGRRHTGTVVAGWLGRGLAVALLAVPFLVASLRGSDVSLIDVVWAALIGAFIWVGASQAILQGTVQQRLPAVSARSLTRRAVPVAVDVPLAEALRRAELVGARGLVVVDGAGSPVGLVSEHAVRRVPVERRPWVSVGDLSRRLEPELTLGADLTGEELVDAITARPASEYLVLEANGDVYGMLAAADVEQALTRT
jgi:Zn-dependent protease/CBS domain-containing protein